MKNVLELLYKDDLPRYCKIKTQSKLTRDEQLMCEKWAKKYNVHLTIEHKIDDCSVVSFNTQNPSV